MSGGTTRIGEYDAGQVYNLVVGVLIYGPFCVVCFNVVDWHRRSKFFFYSYAFLLL